MAYYPHPPQGSKSQWFLDGEGIEYRVIQADISLYLGCDATVTRGYGPDGRKGYYYSSYRPLTSAMVQGMRNDSERYLNKPRVPQYNTNGDLGYTESNPFADSQQRQHGSLSFPAVTEPVAPVAPTSNYYTTSPHYTVPAEYRDGNGRGVIQNGRSEVQYGRGGIQYGTGGTYGAGGRSRAVYPDRDSDTRQRQQPDEGYRQPVYPYRGNPEGQGYPRNRQMASQGDMSGT